MDDGTSIKIVYSSFLLQTSIREEIVYNSCRANNSLLIAQFEFVSQLLGILQLLLLLLAAPCTAVSIVFDDPFSLRWCGSSLCKVQGKRNKVQGLNTMTSKPDTHRQSTLEALMVGLHFLFLES